MNKISSNDIRQNYASYFKFDSLISLSWFWLQKYNQLQALMTTCTGSLKSCMNISDAWKVAEMDP